MGSPVREQISHAAKKKKRKGKNQEWAQNEVKERYKSEDTLNPHPLRRC